MRVAGTILSLSLLVAAVPAFAQGGSYQHGGNWYSRQSMNRDGYGYVPPEVQHLQSPPTYPGDWQQQSSGQQNYRGQSYGQQNPNPYWQPQPGSIQQGMQGGYPSSQTGSFQTGQMGQHPSAPVSSATQGQIKSSLESSGFKNVSVLPQSYLIRATAPDGSKVVMQVSSDGLYGVVVEPTDQASSSGTGGVASTGGTSSSTGSASASTGGTSGTGSASTGGTVSPSGSAGTGGTSTAGTGGTSSVTGATSTGDTSGTGSTSGGTGSLSTAGTGETGSTSGGAGTTSSTGTTSAGGKSSSKGQTTTR